MNRSEIQQLLPVVMQRTLYPGSPLAAILEVMESMHQPAEAALAHLDATFDPRRTPDRFLPFLAYWLHLEHLFDAAPLAPAASAAPAPLSSGFSPLRELIAIATYLARWRGTAKGLILFLETAIDTRGFAVIEQVLDADGQPRPFHLQIRAPESARPHQALIHRIIQAEKPAYVTYELEFFQPPGGQ